MADPAPEKLHRPEDYRPDGHRRLTREDLQQIVDACRPMIAKLIAAGYPARTKKFYQRKAFSLCEEATARGEYIPLSKALEVVRGKFEGA